MKRACNMKWYGCALGVMATVGIAQATYIDATISGGDMVCETFIRGALPKFFPAKYAHKGAFLCADNSGFILGAVQRANGAIACAITGTYDAGGAFHGDLCGVQVP